MNQKKIKEFAFVFGGYTLLTLILTYPVIFRLSTHFMCDGGDGFQNVWNMWWIKKTLTELFTHPYHTDYLHHPEGTTLLFQTLNPFNGLISIPLQFIFKMEVVYNLIVLFSFVMSGVGMYFLVRYLTGHRPAAFISGIIYTFCPYHFAHGLGHLQLIAMEWIPFYVLYLLKMYHEGELRNAVLTGVFLILTTLCSWYYLIYCLLLTVIFVAYLLIAHRKALIESDFLKHLGIALLLFFVCMSPLLGPMAYAKLTMAFEGQHNPETWSADLTSFVIPSGISTWGRMWFEGIWSEWSGNTAENSNYLGYIVLALSIFAIVRIPGSRFWAIAGAIFWIFALGPYLRVMGKQIQIPLPYLLLHNYVPLFSFTGVPERFDVMLKFCMSILAGYAVLELIQIYFPGINDWLNYQHDAEVNPAQAVEKNWQVSGIELVFVAIVGLLICVEYLALPYTTTQVNVPQFYRQMANESDKYAVIDVPSNALTLYYATIHQKPIVGGYISRPPRKALDFLDETPIISTLMRGKPAPPSDQINDALLQLMEYNIRYIITHNDRHRAFLEEVLSLPKVYDAEGIKVYRCVGPVQQ